MVFDRLGVAAHEGPHGAVVQFLRPYLGNSRSRSALLDSPELELGKLLGRGPTGLIGLSLERGVSICGDHYWEDMEGLDIPEFERGTAYLAACDEDLAGYSDVLYSREEMFGWVGAGVLSLREHLPSEGGPIFHGLTALYGADVPIPRLTEKLDGLMPWAHGPAPGKFDETARDRWHAFHVPGFASRYLPPD